MKPVNQKAWLLILPVVICVAFSAILPLMTVVNYSVQDIISPERRVFVGTEWFKSVMRDEELIEALIRQVGFSLAVLAVQIPLGIALALSMPARGWKASAVLVIVAISLLIPWNVVGTIWQIYGRTDIGLLGAALAALGIDYSYTGNARDAWLTVLVMDVWHWTPLVALLCYAGLRAIPETYYEAAIVDEFTAGFAAKGVDFADDLGGVAVIFAGGCDRQRAVGHHVVDQLLGFPGLHLQDLGQVVGVGVTTTTS